MSTVDYSKTSPYYRTPTFGKHLDIAEFPFVPKLAEDVLFTVNKTYAQRPDLLAYDLYGDANLWWVFILRNPDVLQDPVFDMQPGVRFYLPKKETIVSLISG